MTENETTSKAEEDTGGTPPVEEPKVVEKPTGETTQTMDQITKIAEGLFTKGLVVLGLALGILLIFIGSAIINASIVNDEDADNKDYADAKGSYQNGAIIFNLGLAILVLMLLGAAIFMPGLDRYARLGMILAAGIIIAMGFNHAGASYYSS